MTGQVALAYSDVSGSGALSSHEALPSPSSIIVSEADSFSYGWNASRPTNYNPVYTISHSHDGSLPKWIFNLFERLNDLLNLPVNWDTYGADKIDIKAVLYAVALLGDLLDKNIPEPSIVPVSDGSIQFEWHINGVNLEINSQPNGTMEYYSYHDQGECGEYDNEFQYNKVRLPDDFNQCIDLFMEFVEN